MKTRHATIRTWLALAALLAALPAHAGWRVGNGDALRIIFASAKEHAAHVVLKMHERAFLPSVRPDVKAWILANQAALAGDIAASPHEWSLTATPACAETDIGRAAGPIRLSYPTCAAASSGPHAAGDSLHDIGKLLVHESAHHLGVADESTADAIALAIYGAYLRGELEWSATAAGIARSQHASVWTGSQVLVVGGLNGAGQMIAAPQAYDPDTDTWTALPSQGAPARAMMQAVWTGAEMIVWGGYATVGANYIWENSGAAYSPATGAWTPLRTPFGPAQITTLALANQNRFAQTVVWTGREAIVFGGASGAGGIYTPSANSAQRWRAIPTAGAPERAGGHTAVWAGDRMIVWGGKDMDSNKTLTGAVLTLGATPRWTALSTSGAPTAREGHVAAWTGREMVVFGGEHAGMQAETRGTGGVYDPATGWSAFTVESVPARQHHTMVWTGAEMLVYGGKPKSVQVTAKLEAVSAFDPLSKRWRILDGRSEPVGRDFHTAVWTGSSMIILGGVDNRSQRLGTGGIFYP